MKHKPICIAIVMTFCLLAGYGATPAAPNAALASVKSLGSTYWKAVAYGSEEMSLDEFTTEVFLWENGIGYFKIGQASEASRYYGFRHAFDCIWALEGNRLTLRGIGSRFDLVYTGVFDQGRLSLTYDRGGEPITISMEQAAMPPYGTQWDVPDLFGTWRMVSFTFPSTGTVTSDNGLFTIFNIGEYVYSELSVYTTLQAGYKQVTFDGHIETASDLSVTRVPGPIWEGCANKAWHVKLAKNGGKDEQPLYATFADGKLLFKRMIAADSSEHPYTAVYERLDIDLQYDRHEWDQWIGDYHFDEFALPHQNMDYKMSIAKHPESSLLSVYLEVDGSQTMTRKKARVVGNANYIEIVFDSSGDDDMFPDSYLPGEIIVSFSRKGDELYTAWGRLKPMLPENNAPGRYFEKRK